MSPRGRTAAGLGAVVLAGVAAWAPVSRPRWVWTEEDLVAGVHRGLPLASPWDDAWLEIKLAFDPASPRAAWGGEYLPVRDLTILLDRALWKRPPSGPDPLGFRISSLLWHLIACAAAWAFLRRRFGSDLVAVIAAGLFALHPIHAESVLLPANRKDPLFAALVLAALCLLDRDALRSQAGGLAAYAVALLAKLAALGAIPWLLLDRLTGSPRSPTGHGPHPRGESPGLLTPRPPPPPGREGAGGGGGARACPTAGAISACIALAAGAGVLGIWVGRREGVVLGASPWGGLLEAWAAFLGSVGDGIVALVYPGNAHPYHPANLYCLGRGVGPMRHPALVAIGLLAIVPLVRRLFLAARSPRPPSPPLPKGERGTRQGRAARFDDSPSPAGEGGQGVGGPGDIPPGRWPRATDSCRAGGASVAGWLWVWLLPVSPLVAIGILRADRYLYLPALSMGVLLAMAVARVGIRRAAVPLAIIAACSLAWSRSLHATFSGDAPFWREIVRESPDHFDGLVTLARIIRTRRQDVDGGPRSRPRDETLGHLRRASVLIDEAPPAGAEAFLGPRAYLLIAAEIDTSRSPGSPPRPDDGIRKDIGRLSRWMTKEQVRDLEARLKSGSGWR